MQYPTTEYKPVSSKKDEFEEHLGAIVSIVVKGYGRSIAGELVELSDSFITLEHRDGRRSKIRRRDISLISPIPTRKTAASYEPEKRPAWEEREIIQQTAQNKHDMDHLAAWVKAEQLAGRTPTDSEMEEEVIRYAYDGSGIIPEVTGAEYEAAVRARKGI
jgi:hypothetical protein